MITNFACMDITDHDKWVCEQWLAKWTNINKSIETLSAEHLSNLIVYEIQTRKRPKVLDRLIGRYYKLIRKQETKHVLEFIGHI